MKKIHKQGRDGGGDVYRISYLLFKNVRAKNYRLQTTDYTQKLQQIFIEV